MQLAGCLQVNSHYVYVYILMALFTPDKVCLILVPCGTADMSCIMESWKLQGLHVIVRRDLCNGIKLGSKLTVVGVPTHRLANQFQQTYFNITMEVITYLYYTACIISHKFNNLGKQHLYRR